MLEQNPFIIQLNSVKWDQCIIFWFRGLHILSDVSYPLVSFKSCTPCLL